MTVYSENWKEKIPDEACMSRDDLRSLTVPEGVEEIGEGAFAACINLEEIHLPATLYRIDGGAFMHCLSLKGLHVPKSVTEIGDMAFFGCSALRTVCVENPDCRIGSYAFGGFFPEETEAETLELYGGSPESHLQEGRFPCSFPEEAEEPEKLMYALLWCLDGELQPHPEAEAYLREQADRAFQYILRTHRRDLLEALLRGGRIPTERYPAFVRMANEAGQPEFAGMLLHHAARPQNSVDLKEEFAL